MRTLTSDTFQGTYFPEFDDGFGKSVIDRDFARQSCDRKRDGRNHLIRQKCRKVPKPSHPAVALAHEGNVTDHLPNELTRLARNGEY